MINANLLPPEIKQDIAQAKKNTQSVKYIWLTFLIFSFVMATSIGVFLIYNGRVDEANSLLNAQEQQTNKYGSLEAKAKKLAERISAIKAIDAKNNKWSGVIAEVQNVMPAGVYLTSVKFDSSAKVRDSIAGYAKTKQEVATLRDAMEKSTKFEYVDIESSVTEKNPKDQSDVENFTITFSLSKGALK